MANEFDILLNVAEKMAKKINKFKKIFFYKKSIDNKNWICYNVYAFYKKSRNDL